MGMDRYNASDQKLSYEKERSWPGSLGKDIALLFMDVLDYAFLLKGKV